MGLMGPLVSPLVSVYSSSKSFVSHFSRCLYYEYKDNGIKVQHVSPSFVSSKMSNMRPSLMSPAPKKFVQSALCTAGRLKDTCGYLPHDLQKAFCSIVPGFILTTNMKSMMSKIRQK